LKVPQRHCSTSLAFLTTQTRHLHSPGLVNLFFDSPAAAITPSIASKRVNSVSRWCGKIQILLDHSTHQQTLHDQSRSSSHFYVWSS
jgi:hypothetical protein